MSKASPASRSLTGLLLGVYAIFFLSGALGLVYEVLWLRKLLLVFGSTVHATSTVLTVFFGGLALGSWLFGRLIDGSRHAGLRWYAWCEGGIGCYALITPALFEAAKAVYIPIYRASGFSSAALIGGSFACSAVILLIPTTLMGGTFPILSRFLIRAAEDKGAKIAALYSINTFGAMTGTLLVYFVGLRIFGWRTTLICTALLNLLLYVLGTALDRKLREAGFHAKRPADHAAAAPATRAATADASEGAGVLLFAFALSGCSAMIYEVSWTRCLGLVLGSSIYAFCLMLAAFLGGMAAGSALSRAFLARHPARLIYFAAIEGILGAYGAFSIGLFGLMPDVLVKLWPLFSHSFAGLSALQILLSFLAMALPTLLMGFLFPLVSELLTPRLSELGRQIGAIYSVNTVGNILGSALAGFCLIPWVGVAGALMVAGLLNLVASLLVGLEDERHVSMLRRLGLVVVSLAAYTATVLGVFLPAWREHQGALAAGVFLDPKLFTKGVIEDQQNWDLLYYRDGLNTTVTVHRNRMNNEIFLKVGGKTDASSGLDMPTQMLTGHLPLFFRPDAKRVLVIGLGSGVTLGSVGQHPVQTLDCAEIEPAVIEGARLFRPFNHAIHDDPRVRFFAADGRNVLLARPEQYDAIISEPSNPWMAGVATLFTSEFYELAKSRLAPNGVMCQWLQLYRFFPSDVKLVLKTFHDAFPYVTVWSTIPGDMALIGSMQPLHLDQAALERQFGDPKIRADLATLSITHPRALLETFLFDQDAIERLTSNITWRHEDDKLDLEFNAPRAMYMDSTFDLNYDGLDAFREPHEVLTGRPDPPDDAAGVTAVAAVLRARREPKKERKYLEDALARMPNEAWLHLRLGQLHAARGAVTQAEAELRRARELNPASAEAASSLGRLLWKEQRRDDALPVLADAARLDPTNSKLLEEIGSDFGLAKRFSEALGYLQDAARTAEPPRASVLEKLAIALKELQRWEEVRVVASEGRRFAPMNPMFAKLLSQAALAQRQPMEAHQWLNEALRLNPEDADAYFHLARLALTMGNAAAARNFFEAGLRYDPYNIEALNRLHELRSPARPSS